MPEWVSAEKGFIGADVIRWVEGVFERKGIRKIRVTKIGERRIVAEVLQKPLNDGWVYLLVRACEVVSVKPMKLVYLLPKGQEIKRKYKTIMKSKPERLQWSDEEARSMVVDTIRGTKKTGMRPTRRKSKKPGDKSKT